VSSDEPITDSILEGLVTEGSSFNTLSLLDETLVS
jgi:hypothetical protein